MSSDHVHLKIIGYVRSCFREKFGTPRQPGLVPESSGFIELVPQVQPQFSLQGLAGFSHLWVIFLFHKNHQARFHAKIHPPRLEGESIGVYATRSPHRPNELGLSLVKIESVTEKGIYVSGLDIIEGTPVLDIKPYLPAIESVPDARSGWTEAANKAPFELLWTSEVEDFIKNECAEVTGFRDLIHNTLRLDPRPLVYKGFNGEPAPHQRDNHVMRLHDFDIHFCYLSDTQIRVERITIA
jgi:tRNA (adenine37-N6)-methyltransferase